MAITPDDVAHVARLARLELTEAEVARLGRELGQISAYVAQLTELDLAGETPEPVLPLIKSAEALREDEVRPSLPAEKALSGAPDAADGFFRVPKVLG
jgi:aspartyl-tRNA(Asn)/glutamyl-tRNA(Gln) amidotransferase subunit C